MTGRERLLAFLDGKPVDGLPLMPITMMFAGDTAGVAYRRYATDHRALVEAERGPRPSMTSTTSRASPTRPVRRPTAAPPWPTSTTNRRRWTRTRRGSRTRTT
ncbi:MAG: hypothetical protein U0736_20225 [Gemmataceae bacterium]